jgi:Protein of unknown function (DUF433)
MVTLTNLYLDSYRCQTYSQKSQSILNNVAVALVLEGCGFGYLMSLIYLWLDAGLSAEEILEEMPDLEADDLKAALIYASRQLNHPVLVA